MIGRRSLICDQSGTAVIEAAFALPALIIMIWMLVQLGMVYRAVAGIQQALGEGARYATLCLNPTTMGCSTPSATAVQDKIKDSVYGIGPGTFSTPLPTLSTSGTSKYYDLEVNYTQPTSLLLLPGPTISLRRTKRVWVSGS
jgi:Flp pilus assembly protein TadG